MIPRVPLAVMLLAAVAVVPSARAEPSVEERLRALEQQVQRLAQENADLRRELGAKPADVPPPVTVRPAGKATRLAVGGMLQGQAEFGGQPDARWSGSTGNDRFFFRRARLHVTGELAEHFDFKAELDLQGNTLAGGTGHNARANEVYVNWRRFPAANLRFGQLKPAFGGEQLRSDAKMLTIERSLANDRLTDGRQLAAAVLGELFDRRLSYMVVVGNGNGANVSANDNNKFQRSARVAFSPWSAPGRTLTVAVNGLQTEDDAVTRSGLGFTGNTFAGRRSGLGADVAFTAGALDLSAEWLRATYRPTDGVPEPRFHGEGWHLTAAYFLWPAKLQAVVRRESFDPDSERPGDAVDTWLFGLNYHLKGDDLKFQLNYLRGDSAATGEAGRLLTRVQLLF